MNHEVTATGFSFSIKLNIAMNKSALSLSLYTMLDLPYMFVFSFDHCTFRWLFEVIVDWIKDGHGMVLGVCAPVRSSHPHTTQWFTRNFGDQTARLDPLTSIHSDQIPRNSHHLKIPAGMFLGIFPNTKKHTYLVRFFQDNRGATHLRGTEGSKTKSCKEFHDTMTLHLTTSRESSHVFRVVQHLAISKKLWKSYSKFWDMPPMFELYTCWRVVRGS